MNYKEREAEELRIKTNREWVENHRDEIFIDTHDDNGTPTMVSIRGCSEYGHVLTLELDTCKESITNINFLEEFHPVKFKNSYHKHKVKELEGRLSYHKGEIV
jgi:hypothetical protein